MKGCIPKIRVQMTAQFSETSELNVNWERVSLGVSVSPSAGTTGFSFIMQSERVSASV